MDILWWHWVVAGILISTFETIAPGFNIMSMFLLGDRYIDSLKNLSESQNSKFVLYPADLQSTIRGLLGDK